MSVTGEKMTFVVLLLSFMMMKASISFMNPSRSFRLRSTLHSGRRVPLPFRGGYLDRQNVSLSQRLSTKVQMDGNVLENISRDKVELKSFGGLPYLDNRASTIHSNKDSRFPFFRVVFVLGGPGAGKGTQCSLIKEKYPAAHLSVGELLRNEQTKEDSPYKELIRKTLLDGQIVPVDISLELLQQAMREKEVELGSELIYLVDGFPRNFDNLNGWCLNMANYTALWGVLVYQCPLDVLEKRILKRASDSGREDDNLESLRKRFTTFERDTKPIVETLLRASSGSDQWSVIKVRGDQSLDDVWLDTQHAIDKMILHDVVSANVALLNSVKDHKPHIYQSYCDYEGDVNMVMGQREETVNTESGISDAQFEVQTGRQVILSYKRIFSGEIVREKRIWSHQGSKGWQNVHCIRVPWV